MLSDAPIMAIRGAFNGSDIHAHGCVLLYAADGRFWPILGAIMQTLTRSKAIAAKGDGLQLCCLADGNVISADAV